MNKQADTLAASADVTTPLNLYPADFRLLGNYTLAQLTRSLMKDHSEDLRTIEEDEPFKHATASHWKLLPKVAHNQHLRGKNTLRGTLKLLLMG